jgi:decaprenylphospho-beta-D-ribofuranose 2-oxidase
MLVSGWGNYPKEEAKIIKPNSKINIKNYLNENLIARGMGRSYGDSANSKIILSTTEIDNFLNFDKTKGIINVEAGITLREILKIIVPSGWFLPVTPGTSFVTIGGAIASDIHGKNHHHSGTFCEYLNFITVLAGDNRIIKCSKNENSDLFYATCGGMGLTGIIIDAEIRLKKISSSLMNETKIKTNSLEETIENLEDHNSSSYNVAWIDLLTSKKSLGRGIISLGEHVEKKKLKLDFKKSLNIPFYAPSNIISKNIIKSFNIIHFLRSNNQKENVSLLSYFYPLDMLTNWNRLYGKNGFIQYQFYIPSENCLENLKYIIHKIHSSETYVCLGVLKKFGKANNNLLSFPSEGYTLALDFKMSKNTLNFVKELDQIILDMSGRIYLSKDATMNEKTFKKMYKNWNDFQKIRTKYHAIGKFTSSQSVRIGLE